MSTSIVVRAATLADRDRVLGELSDDIYDGFDYLPCSYHIWLYDGYHTMMCAEDGDEIVGFEAIGEYDQGKTLVYHALRVLSTRQGQGIASRLAAALNAKAKQEYPNATRVRVAIQDKLVVSLKMHLKQGYYILSKIGFQIAKITKPMTRNTTDLTKLGVVRFVGLHLAQLLHTFFISLISFRHHKDWILLT
eukprot:m.79282 g.79282  ORF g.79282 m.79282 type:complete len:192 (-) comp14150_c0_seq1:718-1293(-)